jgi:hypothetical protein
MRTSADPAHRVAPRAQLNQQGFGVLLISVECVASSAMDDRNGKGRS